MTEPKWQRSEDCVWQGVDDSLVILDIHSGLYLALNQTSSLLWEHLAVPTTQAELVATLQSSYAVDEARCAAAVARVLEELESKGLARRIASPA